MPLHLYSITNDSHEPALLAWILRDGIEICDSVFITEDKQYLHMQTKLTDVLSGDVIGKLVYTLKLYEQALEILDVDTVLDSNTSTPLRFNTRCPNSSDSNEYYEAELTDGRHLEIETVNRHTRKGELIGTEQNVNISVFPFRLSVHKDISALNVFAGFGEGITVGNTDIKVSGFSDTFIMPCGLFNSEDKPEENYSFLVGTVKSFRNVQFCLGKLILPFIIAQVETALGLVPVAMAADVFDLSELKPGCIVAMNAYIKADLSKPGDFIHNRQA